MDIFTTSENNMDQVSDEEPNIMDVRFFKTVTNDAAKKLHDAFNAANCEFNFEIKESPADIVTKYDKEIEDFIVKRIRKDFPDHVIIAEESKVAGQPVVLTDAPTWIIDPIDGTTNFVSKFPFCCISIAYFEGKQVKLASVTSSVNYCYFFAEAGKGAFLNGERITPSKKKSLQECLILADYGGDRDPKNLQTKVENTHRVLQKTLGVRTMGSAALHCCYVACGRADAFFEYGIHCWDYAAGLLIAKEAGAYCCSCDGSEVDVFGRNIMICSNKELADELKPLLVEVKYDRD